MFLENTTSVPFRYGKIGPQKKLLVFSRGLQLFTTNEVIVYRVIMYANPLVIV